MYISNAEWPEGTYINEYGESISTDEHKTNVQAHSVCKMLMRNGFGGKGEVYPLRVWVTPKHDSE